MRDHSVHELEKRDEEDADEAAAFVLASVNKCQYEGQSSKDEIVQCSVYVECVGSERRKWFYQKELEKRNVKKVKVSE